MIPYVSFYRRCLMLFLSVYLAVSPLAPVAGAADFAEPVSVPSAEVQIESAENNPGGVAQVTANNDYRIIDPVTDVADLGTGRKAYRVYDTPRITYTDSDGKLRVRPDGWNLFDEQAESKLSDNGELGYGYSYPAGKNGELLLITAGDMTFSSGKPSLPHRTPQFSQHTEDHQTISQYKNIYPDVDVRFKDFKWWRSREIVINQTPENLDQNDTVTFWENYNLPAGITVLDGEGKKISGEKLVLNEPLFITLLNGERFVIMPAIVFDSGGEDRVMHKDLTAQSLSQTIRISEDKRTLSIGLDLPASYLLAPERVYPVIIDPTYYACREGYTGSITQLSCSLTDFYLRARNGGTQSDGSAWVNEDLFAGKWLSAGVNYTRHPVMLFNTNFQTLLGSETVDSAELRMYYRNPGNGTASSSGLTPKRITLSNPPYWPPDTVSRIQNDLNYGTFRNNLVAENPSVTTNTTPTAEWRAFTVTTTVQNWKQNNANNLGVLLEPTDSWSSGSTPPSSWANRLFVFDASRNSSNTSPYLYITTTLPPPPPPPPQPDLTHDSITINQSTYYPGQTAEGTISIINNGTAAAAAGRVHVFFNKGTRDYNNADNRVANLSYSSLNSGQTASMNYSFTIPYNAETGDYEFYWWIDATDTSSESNESNNRRYLSTARTVVTGADLVMDTLSINGTSLQPGEILNITPGTTMNISMRTKNQGTDSSSGPGQVYYYFKQGDVDYDTAYRFSSIALSSLAAGSGTTQTTSFAIPSNATYPSYFYYWIDGGLETTETDESNNRRYIILDTRALQPDLIASDLSVQNGSTHAPGDTFQVRARIQNTGGAAVSAAQYTIHLKSGNTAYPLTSLSPSTLNLTVGYDSVVTLQGVISSSAPAGTYDLEVALDPSQLSDDSDYNNNTVTLSSAVTLTQASVDLSASNVVIQDNGRHTPGSSLSVSAQLRNPSSGAVNNVDYRLRMRDVDNGAIYFLESVNPSTVNLNGNTNPTLSLSGTIPSDIPLYRSYAIDVILDPSGNVNDPARGNNTAVSGNSIYTEPGSYGNTGGGGTGTGGAQPCTVRGLQDTECDGVPDNQEKIVGTPSTPGPQSISVTQNQNNRVASSNDHVMGSHKADPVNTRTGALEFTQTDFELSGRGVPIQFERTYNSTITDLNNRLGHGWSYSYNTYYYRDPATLNIVVNFGNRMSMLFTTPDGGVTYVPPDGVFDKLALSGNTYVYRTLEGIEYRFSASDNGSVVDSTMGILQQIVDTNGNVTQLNYTLTNGIPLLTSITDASGRVVSLMYGDPNKAQEWDKIVTMEEAVNPLAGSRRRTEYTYDANGDLILVRSNRAYQGTVEWIERRFTYDANHRMTTYTDPRGTVLRNVYDGTGRVTEQYETKPGGSERKVFELNYTATPVPTGAVRCTEVKNFRDATNFYTQKDCFNSDELLSHRADGEGNTSAFEYHPDFGLLSRVTDPKGNVTNYTYDSRRRKETETLPDINGLRTVVTYAYENNFNRMTSKTETVTGPTALSRTTVYTIDPANGNVTNIEDPLHLHESFTYTSQGNVRTHTNKNGGVMTYSYTPDGNYRESESITVTQADGTNQTIAKRYGYDAYGHLTSYTDPLNFTTVPRVLTTVNEYDTHGNLRKTRDARNQEMSFIYDLENNRTSMTDSETHVTEWVYDKDITSTPTNILSETKVHPTDSAQNRVTRYEYDFAGNRTKMIDPLNGATTFRYNAANRIDQKVTPGDSNTPSLTVNYTYDANGNLTRETNSLNEKTEYDYDARNNKTVTRQFTDATNFIRTENVYDGLSRVERALDGKTIATRFTYDAMDHVLTVLDRANGLTRYTYDPNGNRASERKPNAETDATLRNVNGHTTTLEYDPLNRLIRTTNALNQKTLTFYDANSNVKRVVDRQDAAGTNNDHTATFDYDELNRQTTATDAYLRNSTTTYYPMGNVHTTTDRNNNTTTFAYTPFYQLESSEDAAHNLTTFSYDKAGNKKTVTYPDVTRSTTTYEYDAGNRLIKVIDATVTDGVTGVREYTYDAVGNKKTEKDKNGNVTRYDYDLLNRLETETNAQTTVTTYVYDENDNRLSETTAGKRRIWAYDTMDRIQSLSDRGKMTEQYTYDANGNVQTKTDGNSQTITYAYDGLDRATRKDLPGAAQDVDYAYDNWGNVTTITEAVVTFEGIYDRENRLTNERRRIPELNGGVTAFDLVRSYKPGGELESLIDASGKRVAYNYDNRNLLDTVSYNNTTLADYTQNAMGNPTELLYGNGTRTTYAYDTLNRVSALEVKNAAGGSLLKQEYQYDHESNRKRLTEDGTRTIDYTYDTLGQLTDVDYSSIGGVGSDVHYTYDAWGNRTGLTNPTGSVSYAYPAGSNELQSLSHNAGKLNVSVVYDGNGSLTSEQYSRLGTNVRHTYYRYDVNGRLTGISYTNQGTPNFLPAASANDLTFIYSDDGPPSLGLRWTGNRVGKRANGVWSYSVNNGLNVLDEVSATGAVTKTMVRGLEAIAEIDATGTIQFIHVDVLGSALMMTDQSGAVTKKYEYEAFGQIVGADGSAETKYQFTGQEYDPESELTYMNARYYNAALGRFLSRDPVLGEMGDLIGRNGYVYVNNNPLKYTDPTGEFLETLWDVGNTFYDFGKGVKNLAETTYDSVGLLYNLHVAKDYEKAADFANRYDKDLGELGNATIDIGADALATAIPFVPAGSTKVIRHADDVAKAAKKVTQYADDALKNASKLGKAGENAAGITKPKKAIESLTRTTKSNRRYPDYEDPTKLLEVKNVKKQGYTNQIKDFELHAQKEGKPFILETRPDTKLTKELQNRIDSGSIIRRNIGDTLGKRSSALPAAGGVFAGYAIYSNNSDNK